MSITTTELMEGVKLHKIDTKKYKTNLLAIYITSKLDRMHVTENALMLAILRRGTNKLKTIWWTAIQKNLFSGRQDRS